VTEVAPKLARLIGIRGVVLVVAAVAAFVFGLHVPFFHPDGLWDGH
jgi:hypothetical protein